MTDRTEIEEEATLLAILFWAVSAVFFFAVIAALLGFV